MRTHELASIGVKLIGAWLLVSGVYDVSSTFVVDRFDDSVTHWVYFPAFVTTTAGLIMVWGTKGCLFVMNVAVPAEEVDEFADETPDDSN